MLTFPCYFIRDCILHNVGLFYNYFWKLVIGYSILDIYLFVFCNLSFLIVYSLFIIPYYLFLIFSNLVTAFVFQTTLQDYVGLFARGGGRSSLTPGFDIKSFQDFVYSFIFRLFFMGLRPGVGGLFFN